MSEGLLVVALLYAIFAWLTFMTLTNANERERGEDWVNAHVGAAVTLSIIWPVTVVVIVVSAIVVLITRR